MKNFLILLATVTLNASLGVGQTTASRLIAATWKASDTISTEDGEYYNASGDSATYFYSAGRGGI